MDEGIIQNNTKKILEEKVLETFKGKVERIKGNTAYVALVDSKGQESTATYDAKFLTSLGISEGLSFKYTIATRNGEVISKYELIQEEG